MIQPGEMAPDFALPDQDKNVHKLSDYRGKPVVLLFYPLDFSPVCSNEMACFRDALSVFNDLDAQVFGISVDSVWAHKAFAAQQGIEFPLLADFHPKGDVCKKYGVYLEDKGICDRVVVVIDPEGRVSEVIHVGIPNVPDVEQVAEAVKKAAAATA
ncbi:redoxin domain-containing protein [Ardenticatena maritima]|nr:redoxin domain-containing protein [Ardenticatena maritima]